MRFTTNEAKQNETKRNQVRKIGRVLQRLMPKDATRGLRRHPMVFQGKDAVDLLIETCVAKDATDALAIGNAFLRESTFLGYIDGIYRLYICLLLVGAIMLMYTFGICIETCLLVGIHTRALLCR